MGEGQRASLWPRRGLVTALAEEDPTSPLDLLSHPQVGASMGGLAAAWRAWES